MTDLVAVWNVPMNDKVHKVEFEHGTKTGKRVVKIDDQVCVIFMNPLFLCRNFDFYFIT